MDNLAALILLGFICMAVGVALGSAIMGVRGERGRPAAGLEEIAHLWRDKRNGHLIPEIDGKIFQMSGGLSSTQRSILIQVLEDLRIWLGVQAVASSAVTKPPAIQEGLSQTHAVPADLGVVNSSSLNPVNVLARVISTDVAKPAAVKSIAAQIDDILQEDLENSHLKNLAIRLLELPGKGMVVMVGLEQYDSVNSVPDPEIRDLIHRAVARWEQRSSGD
jgi:hypothetical protein